MFVEAHCAREALQLVARGPVKYGPGISSLYAMSLFDRDLGKTARCSYFLLRHADDAADGDRNIRGSAERYVRSMRDAVASGDYRDAPPATRLAKPAIRLLEKRGTPDDNPRQEIIRVMDTLLFDMQRKRERRVLTEKELDDYYHSFNEPIHNIMLTALGSRFRGSDVSDMTDAWGVAASVLDFHSDWSRGLLNVPKHILDQANLTADSPAKDVIGHPHVSEWFASSLHGHKEKLDQFLERIKEWDEPLARRVYRFAGRGFRRKVNRALASV